MLGHFSRRLAGGAARNLFQKTGGSLGGTPSRHSSLLSPSFIAPLSSLSSPLSSFSALSLPPPPSTMMMSKRLLHFDASDPHGVEKLQRSADQHPLDGMKQYMLLRELVKHERYWEAAQRLNDSKYTIDPRARTEITPVLEANGYGKGGYTTAPTGGMYPPPGPYGGGMVGGLGGKAGEPLEVEVVRPKSEKVVGTLAFVAFYLFIFAMLYNSRNPGKGGNPLSSLGVQTKAHKKSEGSEVTFEDVLGCDESKAQLEEIVSYLKSPMQFLRLGATLPKGVLLVGPPGTGKTLLAKSIAGEAGVPFYYASGPDFDELYVGLGPKRVRELFEEAQANSPSIVFIDEIDTIGQRRQALHNNRDGTLNQLLTELDGFEENSGVIILAATNLLETIDPALLRSGRFDKVVDVPVPDVKGRTEILGHYVKKVSTLENVTEEVIEKLARATVGMTGADLSNLVNQAAIKAGLENEEGVSAHQLEEAYENMLLGVGRKSAVISEESKRLTAFHEGGHALVAWVLREGGALPIRRATILPRGNALGYVAQLPDKDQTSYSRKQMLAKIAVCMAGRLSEEMIFGKDEVTSGGSSDLKQASNLAVEMVSRWGMSDELGPQYIQKKGEHGGATQEVIDREVKKILDQEEARAREILTIHKNELFALATALLKYETLSGEQIETLLKGGSI